MGPSGLNWENDSESSNKFELVKFIYSLCKIEGGNCSVEIRHSSHVVSKICFFKNIVQFILV